MSRREHTESVETRETGPASKQARAHPGLLMIPGIIKSFGNPRRRSSFSVGRNVPLNTRCQTVDLTDGVSGLRRGRGEEPLC